jgi:hypothetical protein
VDYGQVREPVAGVLVDDLIADEVPSHERGVQTPEGAALQGRVKFTSAMSEERDLMRKGG